MGGVSWVPTHDQTSGFKTTTVFFSRKYGFNVLPLCLHSALYSCPCRTSRFLEAVATTRTTMMLAYNTTNHKISCHQLVRCHVWCYENLLHRSTLWFTAAVASGFLCHCSYVCTCLNHELELCGQDSMHAHTQLSHFYFASTLDVTHVIKSFPNLSRYYICCWN